MKTNTRSIKNAFGRRNRRSPLRLTALLYLREALINERYENCREIIAYARLFGAAQADIRILLEDPRRVPR